MDFEDVLEILEECRRMFPFNYYRWILVYPPRVVILKMLERYPEQVFPLVRRRFERSREFEEACEAITESYEQVFR
jgi:hypothetical protein